MKSHIPLFVVVPKEEGCLALDFVTDELGGDISMSLIILKALILRCHLV